ncbi:DUF4431 domain-containing protein [Fulvimonas yonginensis]|uniref:DUF4431 domain-containing protein n=1 Tax=Fulvimonas yonginensis TaxID=1495200 RepID=UPI003CE59A17
MRALPTLILFTLLASSLSGAALASEPVHPKSDPCFADHAVTLLGVLTTHQEYGPPGWGEYPTHDRRWTMVVLNVSHATAKKIAGLLKDCFDDTASFTQVQLWSQQGPGALSKYQGKEVRVMGSLRAASGAPAELHDAQVWVSNISMIQ